MAVGPGRPPTTSFPSMPPASTPSFRAAPRPPWRRPVQIQLGCSRTDSTTPSRALSLLPFYFVVVDGYGGTPQDVDGGEHARVMQEISSSSPRLALLWVGRRSPLRVRAQLPWPLPSSLANRCIPSQQFAMFFSSVLCV